MIHFGVNHFVCLTQKHVPQQVAIIHMFIVIVLSVIISRFVLICRNNPSQEIDTDNELLLQCTIGQILLFGSAFVCTQ